MTEIRDPFQTIAAQVAAALPKLRTAPVLVAGMEGYNGTVSNEPPEPEIALGEPPSPAPPPRPSPGPNKKGEAKPRSGKRRRPPQRDSLIGLGDDCEFWIGTDSETYASYKNGKGIVRHTMIASREFKIELSQRAYLTLGEVPGSQAIDDVLRIFSAKAMSGPVHEPLLRIGMGAAGAINIDMGDEFGNFIEIGPHGFKILNDGRPKFIRRKGMTKFIEPQPGSSIQLLRPFLNVENNSDFVLVVAWLLMALRPSGPFPILALAGEQGAGKSTFSILLRRLTDPSAVPISAPPKDVHDLVINAMNARVLVFDNLSKIDAELSDALCRIATGGGARKRSLHTDHDETIFSGSRPVILNGIGHLGERADLADRTIAVRLVPIADTVRKSEHDFWHEFDEAEPSILGALLDAVSHGIKNFETTKLKHSPRLADFARWLVACEPGLGEDWEQGTFMDALTANRKEVRESAFESDPVAVAIDDFVRRVRPGGWSGTATELLAVLSTTTPEEIRRRRDWPITAQGLGNRLDRAAPLLRSRGVLVERQRSTVRTIALSLRSTSGEPS